MITRRLKKSKKWGFIKLGFLIYVPVGLFALAWLGTAVSNLEYGINQLQKQKEQVTRDRKLLSADRANVYSMKNIEEVAIKELGMSLPERENVFLVKRVQAAGPYGASMKLSPGIASSEKRLSGRNEDIRQVHYPVYNNNFKTNVR